MDKWCKPRENFKLGSISSVYSESILFWDDILIYFSLLEYHDQKIREKYISARTLVRRRSLGHRLCCAEDRTLVPLRRTGAKASSAWDIFFLIFPCFLTLFKNKTLDEPTFIPYNQLWCVSMPIYFCLQIWGHTGIHHERRILHYEDDIPAQVSSVSYGTRLP